MSKNQYILYQYMTKNQYILYQYMSKNQYNLYQYIAKNGQFISTFCSTFAKSVQEVHWSTYKYEWPPWCSSYPGKEALSPDFGRFLTILGIFQAVCFGTSL